MSLIPVSSLTVSVADACIVDVSEGFCQQFGWLASELHGQSLLQSCWPDSQAWQRLLLASLNQHSVRHFTASLRDAAGVTVPVSLIGTPLQLNQQALLQLLIVPAMSAEAAASVAPCLPPRQSEDCAACPVDRFHTLFHSHNAPFLLVDPADGRIADANAAALAFYGYPAEQLLGMPITRINILSPEQMAEERATALLQQRNYFVFPHRLCNGEIRTVEVHSSPVEVGGRTLMFSVVHDVSARRQSEALMLAQARVIELIAMRAPLPVVLNCLAQQLEELADGCKVAVMLYDEQLHTLRLGATGSLPVSYTSGLEGRLKVGPDFGSCGSSAYSQRPVLVADIATAPGWADFRDLALSHGLRACWSHPVLSAKGRVLGTVSLYATSPGLPGEYRQRLLDMAAKVAAVAIAQAQEQGELLASRQRMHQIIEFLPDAIFAIDNRGRVIAWNRAIQEMTGIPAAQVLGKGDHEYALPFYGDRRKVLVDMALNEPLDRIRERYLAVHIDGDTISAESTTCRIRGEPRHIFGKARPLYDAEGNKIGAIELIRDITAIRQAERQLRDSEAYNKLLFADSFIPLVVLDPHTRCFVDCNQAAVDIYGLQTREQVMGKSPADVSAAMQYDGRASSVAAPEMVQRCLEQGHHVFEWRHQRPDGAIWDAQVHLMRFQHGDRTLLQFSLEDITERKRNEQKLRLAARVFESTGEGIVITRPDGEIIAVNPAFSEITGYSEAEALGQNPRLLNSGRQPPEFYAAMWQAVGNGHQWRGEIWNRRKNGEVYPEWLTLSAVKDEQGRISNYVGVFSDISLLKNSQQTAEFLARHDALTGLPNRTLFQDRLQHAVTRARRDNQSMAVLFLDLDHFKNVNDTLGHSVGDQLLRYVAQQMADQLRQCDTIARLGGDEFVVLLEQDVTPESLQVVVNKLLGLFVEPLQIAERLFYITASIGISRYPQDAQDADNLLKQADLAMYDAKRKGRNMAQHYQVALSADLLDRMSLENELRKAVRNNQLLLHYQPQFELDGEHLAGVEALVRWQHPELGMIPPSRFIPLAEEMGLISEIGDWVMQQACAQVAAWREQGFNVPRMAVNLSVQQIEHRDLASRVARLLNQYRLDAGQLELEVTESTLMGQHQHATQTLFDLEKLGVQLSIDDFGTGYSSLSYLKRLPVHRLKIDRSFIRDIGRDPHDEATVRAAIALGHSMSLQVLAEGVERPEQADFLRREGCHLVQGYWYGKPLTADEIYQRFGPPAAK